ITRPAPHSALTVFDASHGQPNWAQTGFTSRELHTNFAGVMELLCRFGLTCSPTGLEPLPQMLARARLLVIPPPAGNYNALNGLIVFGGPAGGLISAGFQLEPPNLQSAPHAVRNQCQDAISACIRQWPEGTQIQILQTRA